MHPSPLLSTFRSANAPLLSWGVTDAFSGIDSPAALAPIEMEYASIRKHCALLDLPMRGVLEVRGPERLDFLNRMITQELRGATGAQAAKGMPTQHNRPFEVGQVRRGFWLNRKGRVDADLRVLNLPERVLLEVDALVSERTRASLDVYLISEDCTIGDLTHSTHRLGLHGPTAWELLTMADASLAGRVGADGMDPGGMDTGHCNAITIAGQACVVYREDSAGVPGYELVVPAGEVSAIVSRLIELGHNASHERSDEPGRAIALRQAENPSAMIRLQPIGWHAFNLARVESGTPLFNVDFGSENLPAETGVLEDRVSFTKGCYLGQEVVARMHSRGQSKQTLVGIRFARPAGKPGAGKEDEGDNPYPPLPERGAPVGTVDASGALVPIGSITSAVPSPMLGMAPIAFAQVRSVSAVPGTVVVADAEGVRLSGTIQPTLRMWPSNAVRSGA